MAVVKPDSAKTSYQWFAVGAVVYLGLHLIAARNDSPLWWGVDSWRYLPPMLPWVFFAVGVVSLIPWIQRRLKPLALGAEGLISRIPLGAWLLLSAVVFWGLKEKTFFLGDGFLRMREIETDVLFTFEEPLDTLLHGAFYQVFHPLLGITGQQVYQWVSILLGVVAVGGVVHLVGKVHSDRGLRWFIGGLLACAGSVQLFFGYVESYTLLNCLSLLFLLSGLRMLKTGEFSFLPIGLFSAGLITHPAGFLLAPGALFVYLKVIQGDRAGGPASWRSAAPVLVPTATVCALLAVFWKTGHPPWEFIQHYLRGGNLLPLVSSQGTYGLLSSAHFLDLANALLLFAPALMALPLIVARPRGASSTASVLFLFLCAIGPLAFAGLLNPKLGYARDWDLFSFAAFPLTLFLAESAVARGAVDLFRIACPLLLIGALHTLPWVGINASPSASLRRFEILADTPYWSNFSKGYAHQDLGDYYAHAGKPAESIDHYAKAFDLGRNPRAFERVVSAYYNAGDFEEVIKFVNRYELTADSHFALGMAYLAKRMPQKANQEFEEVLALDPAHLNTHFQLAQISFDRQMYEDCIREYRAEFALRESLQGEGKPVPSVESRNLDVVYGNLGYAYLATGRVGQAIETFTEALKTDPQFAAAHFYLAYAYSSLGDYQGALSEAAAAEKSGFDRRLVQQLFDEIRRKLVPHAGR